MKKVAMVIAERDFRDEEFLKPKEVLEKAGIAVKVVSTSLNMAFGVLGAEVKPDLLLKDIKAEDFSALVFVGGAGASRYWDDPLSHKLVRDAESAGKVVAAICIAPVILSRAGILKGKKATVWSSEAEQLRSGGAEYTAAAVEQDGNIITASGPQAAQEFGRTVLKAISD